MIKTYYKFGDDGRLVSTLHLTPEEAATQGNLTLDAPDFLDGEWPWRVGDAWEARPMTIVTTPLADLRRASYPPIAEQLDMLWHAMDVGEIPVAASFYESIRQVKDMLPKDPVVFEVGPMPEA